MSCRIEKQISEHCDEPEAVECPECQSSMTEYFENLLECDECSCTVFKGDSNE